MSCQRRIVWCDGLNRYATDARARDSARFGANRADVFDWRSGRVCYSSGLAKLWINRGRGLASILYDASRSDRRLAG